MNVKYDICERQLQHTWDSFHFLFQTLNCTFYSLVFHFFSSYIFDIVDCRSLQVQNDEKNQNKCFQSTVPVQSLAHLSVISYNVCSTTAADMAYFDALRNLQRARKQSGGRDLGYLQMNGILNNFFLFRWPDTCSFFIIPRRLFLVLIADDSRAKHDFKLLYHTLRVDPFRTFFCLAREFVLFAVLKNRSGHRLHPPRKVYVVPVGQALSIDGRSNLVEFIQS